MSLPDSSTSAADRGAGSLSGRRILVIEDSPVVGPFTAEMLAELGCAVIGPAPNMASARQLIESEDLDAALVDLHIRGERAFALGEMLAAKGVPFIVTSGYADWQMPDEWALRPRLQKPYTIEQVREALERLLVEQPT
jgi:DNA-binding NtrC family response regulator